MRGDHVDEVVAEFWEERGLPVVVPPVEDRRVERALESYVRHGPDQVEEGSPRCAERTEHLLTVLDRPGVAGADHHHRAPVQMLGDGRQRWRGAKPHDRAEFVWSVAYEVAVEAKDLRGVRRVPEDGPGEGRGPDRVEAELERGDDAEIAAAASQRPEQVGVLVLGRPQPRAVGRHDVDGKQIVDCEPVLAHQPADAAAESEAGDSGVAHDSAGGGQTVRLRLAVDVAPQRTALHPGPAAGGIDPHRSHRREVDDDAIVANGGARHVVASAPYGDLQIVLAGETYGRDHVAGPDASG